MSVPAGNVLGVTIRHDLRPGDVGMIVHLHGTLYQPLYCFDAAFEAYVAGPLAEFVKTRSARELVWLVDRGETLRGSLAVVRHSDRTAQLR